MKPLPFSIYFLLFSVLGTSSAFTQDLSNLIPFAHYTLINTPEDALGKNPPIELYEAPYAGLEGVYSNGYYDGTAMDTGLVRTVHMDALYDSVFAVQVQFKTDVLDGIGRSVIICGDNWKYLGLMLESDNSFKLLINNTLIPTTIAATSNTWYEITIIHHQNTTWTEWYLDGSKIGEKIESLQRAQDDGGISNTHYGNGVRFKGHWRQLRVYGSEMLSGVTDLSGSQIEIITFPNPASESIWGARWRTRASSWCGATC
jgi:hypothetical protein